MIIFRLILSACQYCLLEVSLKNGLLKCLQEFLERHGTESSEGHDAIYAFLLHQAMELGKDCLEKSQQDVISHHYFNEITNKLRTLMEDVSI